jgi:hypothetical protein
MALDFVVGFIGGGGDVNGHSGKKFPLATMP